MDTCGHPDIGLMIRTGTIGYQAHGWPDPMVSTYGRQDIGDMKEAIMVGGVDTGVHMFDFMAV